MATWRNEEIFVENQQLSPAILFPDAFPEGGYATGPERDLLSALLFDGIQSYLNYGKSRSSEDRARYREACAWIHKESDEYVFSFINVCDALGVDANFLRLGLGNVTSSELMRGKRRG